MKRRSFLAKIFSSAIAAPAVAGIIERGISKPLPDAKCVGVTGTMQFSWSPEPLRLNWDEETKTWSHEAYLR